MITTSITVINKLGLHARAASKLVKLASGFECSLKMTGRNQEVDVKSIMGILMLAASQGSEIELTAEGSDEQAAVSAISDLFADYFGEGE